ncbi:hypothetical protein G4B88_006304 [Cannabis sativa]|uniref:Sieve element occlusion n=1 Tax=Cannabis sativa TaxID=3483 RepID=A0A7J6ICU9_CANSA|nr:hypothetical protein G4B88_006304 [Cannabis sativa]
MPLIRVPVHIHQMESPHNNNNNNAEAGDHDIINNDDGDDDVYHDIVSSNILDSGHCNILHVRPLLNIMDIIFNNGVADHLSAQIFIMGNNMAATELPDHYQSMHKELPRRMIRAIFEILNKCWDGGVDQIQMITKEILQITKQYKWDAKVVLVLLALATSISQFPLVLCHYKTNPVANAVALLNQYFPHFSLEHEVVDAFFTLNKQILDVTTKVVDFYDFPLHNFFTDESPEILAANSYMPFAVYWIIRSIVVSLTQILTFTYKRIVLLKSEQSKSVKNLNDIKGHLLELIENRNRSAKNKKGSTADRYQELLETLLRSSSNTTDNSKTLNILFDKPGLHDCYYKKKVSNKDLTNKVVALFISGLENDLTTGAECAIIQQMYMEKWHNPSRISSNFEVVWVPINLDTNNSWSEENMELFKRLRDQMEWYSVEDPSKLDLMVVKFIIGHLNFLENPLLVVLDTQGKIVHNNGIYMMCTWGSLAYPFTTHIEESLWEEMSWSIDLLVDNMDLNKDIWILEGKHICLYGGDDVKWIKKFIKTAKVVANTARVDLKFLYVGRSKLKKKLVKVIDIIRKETFSNSLDWNIIWYFWVRLESMLYSKKLHRRGNWDSILQGIITLLRFDSEHKNWAIISSESGEMVMADGQRMLMGLRELLKLKSRDKIKGCFVPALTEYINNTCSAPSAALDIFATTMSKKDYEVFNVVECILETSNLHDSKYRSVLFNFNYTHKAIFNDLYSKKRISNYNLRRKVVVLFITDLDPELPLGFEYAILKRIYHEKCNNPTKTESQFDLVWVPIMDHWASEDGKTFESLREHMEWYSVHHPLMVPLKVIRYIKEKWNFTKKPLIVVMDTQGKIVHRNPIHAMCIWGTQAFPFSTDQETLMWKNTKWSIDLIMDNLEPDMLNWVQENKHVCLYGSEDIDWIRNFTTVAKNVAREANITLELIYVGESNPCDKEKVKNVIDIIVQENLSRTLEWDNMWYFWMRLESMSKSIKQHLKPKNMMNDPVIKGIDAMRGYGWGAMIGMGLSKMVISSNFCMLNALVSYDKWKSRKDVIGFVPALEEYINSGFRTFEYMSDDQHHVLRMHDDAYDLDRLRRYYVLLEQSLIEHVLEMIERMYLNNPDNLKSLVALFYFFSKYGNPQLYDGSTKKRFDDLEKLKGKVVALFITDVDVELTNRDEYLLMCQMYLEKKQCNNKYEVVWAPIKVFWDNDLVELFMTMREKMECYTIYNSVALSPAIISSIIKKWKFNIEKPMVLVLDERGQYVHYNALYMMGIWGIRAYPFSYVREEELWEQNNCWNFNFILHRLHPDITNWMVEKRYICLYGGDDIGWIRKFTRAAKEVARRSHIPLELLYVGTRSKDPLANEKARLNIIDMVSNENLSVSLDIKLMRHFWMRIESMNFSKEQLMAEDLMSERIFEMFHYGSNEKGWALISRGEYDDVVMGNGDHMFLVFVEHLRWILREKRLGFLPALDVYLRKIQHDDMTQQITISFPPNFYISKLVCFVCGRVMSKYIMLVHSSDGE